MIFNFPILTKLATKIDGVMYVPGEIERNPIFPENGARTAVFAICARINWLCAWADFKSAWAISYSSSWLMASFWSSNWRVVRFQLANPSLVLACPSCARSSTSFTLNNNCPLLT